MAQIFAQVIGLIKCCLRIRMLYIERRCVVIGTNQKVRERAAGNCNSYLDDRLQGHRCWGDQSIVGGGRP